MVVRHHAAELVAFAERLLAATGLDAEKSRVTAELLVEADLMGHTTHGLALLGPYLGCLDRGEMEKEGPPDVIGEAPAALTWDGRWLPGLWLTAAAVDAAALRAKVHGTGTVAIRRAHHIACLAAFLPRATARGLMVVIASSDPAAASVAPFGGIEPLITPNPIAVGIPTPGDPILIDISASITTNGMSARLAAAGERAPSTWYLDALGQPTDDPAVIAAKPPGTILPAGGLDHGHKGYGLGLAIEAWTQALSGFGRADAPTRWGASVFVQVLDPALFGGLEAFARQSGWLADRARATPPRPGGPAVRLPGEAALRRRAEALADGLELHPAILPVLTREAEKRGVGLPAGA